VAVGQCRLRVTLDGTSLSRTADFEVKPLVLILPEVLPSPVGYRHLNAIWAGDDAGVFIAGSEDPGKRLVLGGSPSSGFARLDTMPPPTMGDGGHFTALDAIWASGPSDVWAAGYGVVHFDGATWTELSTERVNSVWGSGPTDVWFGGARLLHYDGGELAAFGGATNVDEVSGSGPTEVWLRSGPALSRFDGMSWTSELKPDGGAWTSLELWNHVHSASVPPTNASGTPWGTSASDVWQVNFYFAMHWDGRYWEQFQVGNAPDLKAVFGTSTDVWFLGENALFRYRR